MLGFYLWFFVALFIMVGCFGGIVIILEKRLNSPLMPSNSVSHQNSRTLQRELVLYLCILLFIRIFSLMDRFQNLISNEPAPVFVLYAHALGDSLQGLWLFSLFCVCVCVCVCVNVCVLIC